MFNILDSKHPPLICHIYLLPSIGSISKWRKEKIEWMLASYNVKKLFKMIKIECIELCKTTKSGTKYININGLQWLM